MNSLANNNIRIFGLFLIFIMVFTFGCDDIFVEDISDCEIQLNTPSSGWQGKDTNVSFRWENVPEAVNYRLEVVTPSFSVNHKLVFEKLLFDSKFDTLLTPGVYEWRIKALNSASATKFSYSSFSILDLFNISSKQTSLETPEDQFVSNSNVIDFRWEVMEGASFYSFKIKKSNWMGDSVAVVKLYSTNFKFRLDDGLYAWGVAAIDTITGKKTDYTLRSLTIDNNPPSVPKLITPINNDTVHSLTASFSWHKSEPEATYSIAVYSDPELKNIVMEKAISDTITFINLNKEGCYFWNVKSIDKHGNSSKISPSSIFSVKLSTDINQKQVSLISPANESLIVNKKVVFWWDLLSGAEKYNIQIVSPSFSNPLRMVLDQWVTNNSVALELDPGQYEWRVKAQNISFVTDYRQSSFSIYNTDLSLQKTILLEPQYAEMINSKTVKLKWKSINGNASYHLLIKRDSWESGSIIQEVNTNETEIELPFLNGDFFWGVKAIDPQNNTETEYSVRKFVVDYKGNLSEEEVLLISPVKNSMLIDKSVTFWWNALRDAEKYNLQIVSPSFATPEKLIYDESLITNSFTINLAPGKYEWRVKAVNSFSQTKYSQSNLSIYDTDLTNLRTILLSPGYGQLVNTSLIKLSWAKISSNASYQVMIRKDSWETGNIVVDIKSDKLEEDVSLPDGTYYWGLKAIDPINKSETEYSIRKLVVELKSNISNSPVSLLSPSDKSTIFVNKTILWWNQVAGSEKYNIQIVSPSFANPTKLVCDQWVTTNSYAAELASGDYQWRVKASNNISETAFSTFSLTVNTNDISKQKVSLIRPLYNELTNLSSIKFSWEMISGDVVYHLLIKKDSWESGSTVQEINTLNTEVELPLLEGNYFWGIKATDIHNSSETVYVTRSLVVDLTSPEIPNLVTPVNNFTSSDFLVNFSWVPGDVTDKKVTYTLEVFQINSSSAVQLSSKTTQQNTVGYNLESLGKYKWRVYATDLAGNRGEYSEFRYFEIK